ncbi:MAG: M56 family metallopeptidase, partial [Planctomycetes bacterium]|nr:M56 family metallopeptidase [Planctomycetota bacterium]
MNALSEILSHPFVHKLGWTLLHLLWQGAAVALLLGIVLCLLRKSSANVRYVVACSALALVVLAPAVTFCLISAPPASAGIESAPVALLAESLQERYTSDMPLIRAAEYMGMFTHTSWTQRVEDFCAPALPYIVAGWLLGVVGLSLYHLGGWTHLQRLRRRLTKQADASLLAKLGVLAEELRITRPVRLLESALVQIPTVVGWLRPVILLPATALTGLTSDQVEALLAHELAHIRRGDYLINMLQTVVEILGFYHPAVWWISNKIRLERENCCDDIAVAICGDKMHYATALAEMERIRSARGELALAANGGNLLTRIRRLIGKGPAPKSRFNWAAALVTAMVIAALAIPTTLALSRKYSSNAPLQPIVPATSETTDKLSAASVVDEAQGLAQITFVCKIFELPADLHALELEPGEETQEGLYVRTGNNYAQTLETLA